MRRPFKIALFVLGGLLLLAVVAFLSLYFASQHVPDFYRQAMAADPKQQREAHDRAIDQIRNLHEGLRHASPQQAAPWRVEFTAEEINGLLALELADDRKEGTLPAELHDPRIAIDPDGITVAARVERGRFKSVVSLKVDAYIESAGQLALEIHKARAGAVPWPVQQVVENLKKAADKAGVGLTWRQNNGDPVALLKDLHLKIDRRELDVRPQAVTLEKGKIILSGTVQRE